MTNEELVRAACKAIWSDHDLDKADELYAPDFIAHYPSVAMPPVPPGPAGVKELARSILEGFPDYHETVEDIVASGDRVAVRLTLRGTNTGPLADGTTTGKSIEFTDMTMVRIENGKIAELWGLSDHITMMTQLGLFDATTPSPTETA
ncbi:MAG: ester cyclase [Actinomycetota bacterium]